MQNEQRRAKALLRPMRQQEELAVQQFAAAKSEVSLLQDRLAGLHRSLAVHNEFARQTLAASRPAGTAELVFYRKCVADITSELADCCRCLATAEQAMQLCQDELLEARKQRQAFEQFAEKVDVRAKTNERRRTTAELDQTHEAQRSWQQAGVAAGQE
jgi:flagellar biosynthesis chaperone FliJ